MALQILASWQAGPEKRPWEDKMTHAASSSDEDEKFTTVFDEDGKPRHWFADDDFADEFSGPDAAGAPAA